jgi:hypothetical protein
VGNCRPAGHLMAPQRQPYFGLSVWACPDATAFRNMPFNPYSFLRLHPLVVLRAAGRSQLSPTQCVPPPRHSAVVDYTHVWSFFRLFFGGAMGAKHILDRSLTGVFLRALSHPKSKGSGTS